VTEATNPALELFGEAHLIDTLNLAEAEKPSEVICFVRSALERFAGGSPQSDDITMLCFKYLG
jgi:sigma-B regulation protein RsbU (phosphoserine phosphatase)